MPKSNYCCWFHARFNMVCQPPTDLCKWVVLAHRVVKSEYPSFNPDAPAGQEALKALDYCLDEHFLTPGSFMDLEGVKEAWRSFYRLCV